MTELDNKHLLEHCRVLYEGISGELDDFEDTFAHVLARHIQSKMNNWVTSRNDYESAIYNMCEVVLAAYYNHYERRINKRVRQERGSSDVTYTKSNK